MESILTYRINYFAIHVFYLQPPCAISVINRYCQNCIVHQKRNGTLNVSHAHNVVECLQRKGILQSMGCRIILIVIIRIVLSVSKNVRKNFIKLKMIRLNYLYWDKLLVIIVLSIDNDTLKKRLFTRVVLNNINKSKKNN